MPNVADFSQESQQGLGFLGFLRGAHHHVPAAVHLSLERQRGLEDREDPYGEKTRPGQCPEQQLIAPVDDK
jgi:hypothetical protein